MHIPVETEQAPVLLLIDISSTFGRAIRFCHMSILRRTVLFYLIPFLFPLSWPRGGVFYTRCKANKRQQQHSCTRATFETIRLFLISCLVETVLDGDDGEVLRELLVVVAQLGGGELLVTSAVLVLSRQNAKATVRSSSNNNNNFRWAGKVAACAKLK